LADVTNVASMANDRAVGGNRIIRMDHGVDMDRASGV
jgi:hypothetical protein